MAHTCHATDCETPVPPEMWGCKRHWLLVPHPIRIRIVRAYRVGQCEDWQPSREYLVAAREAVVAVAEREGKTPDTTLYDPFSCEDPMKAAMRLRIELSFVVDGDLPPMQSVPLLDAFEAVVRTLYHPPDDTIIAIEADGRAKFTTLLRPTKRKKRS